MVSGRFRRRDGAPGKIGCYLVRLHFCQILPSRQPCCNPICIPNCIPPGLLAGCFPGNTAGANRQTNPGVYPVTILGKWRQVQLRGRPLICCREVGKGRAPEGPLLALWESLVGEIEGGGHGPPGVVGYSCR